MHGAGDAATKKRQHLRYRPTDFSLGVECTHCRDDGAHVTTCALEDCVIHDPCRTCCRGRSIGHHRAGRQEAKQGRQIDAVAHKVGPEIEQRRIVINHEGAGIQGAGRNHARQYLAQRQGIDTGDINIDFGVARQTGDTGDNQLAVIPGAGRCDADAAAGGLGKTVELQNAATHRRVTGIGVAADNRQGAAAAFDQIAAATDDIAVGKTVAAIERHRAVVHNIAQHRAAGAAIAELQGAGGDCGAAAVEIAAGQDGGAAAFVEQIAAAADNAGIGDGVLAIEGQCGVVGDVAAH